jgi:hypothetical protein
LLAAARVDLIFLPNWEFLRNKLNSPLNTNKNE